MKGTIVKILPVLNLLDQPFHARTVIYERNGKQYRGCLVADDTYYFGPDGHNKYSNDIDEAWAWSYPMEARHDAKT